MLHIVTSMISAIAETRRPVTKLEPSARMIPIPTGDEEQDTRGQFRGTPHPFPLQERRCVSR